jgi:hypothetical protein
MSYIRLNRNKQVYPDIRLIRISGFVKLTSLELGIRISLLCPHPDHPHVVPDHVGVQGRVPVHLPLLIALKPATVQRISLRTNFQSSKVIETLLFRLKLFVVKIRSELTKS